MIERTTKEEIMNTHRLLQVHNLLDAVESKARSCRRAAENLARINNNAGAGHFLRKAARLDRIAGKCSAKLVTQ